MEFFACYELGIPPVEFEAMDWAEYERRVWHYRLQLARRQEPFRDLQAQLVNMFAEQPLRPHELYQLVTDRFDPTLRHRPAAKLQAQKDHWQRMVALGLVPG